MVSLKLFVLKSVSTFLTPRILVLKDIWDERIEISSNYLPAFLTPDMKHFQNNTTNISIENMITEYS